MSEPTFDDGVLWAVARIIDWYDDMKLAGQLLQESGVDPKGAVEMDAPFIARLTEEDYA